MCVQSSALFFILTDFISRKKIRFLNWTEWCPLFLIEKLSFKLGHFKKQSLLFKSVLLLFLLKRKCSQFVSVAWVWSVVFDFFKSELGGVTVTRLWLSAHLWGDVENRVTLTNDSKLRCCCWGSMCTWVWFLCETTRIKIVRKKIEFWDFGHEKVDSQAGFTWWTLRFQGKTCNSITLSVPQY